MIVFKADLPFHRSCLFANSYIHFKYSFLPFLHVICFLHFIFFFSFYLSLLFLHVICFLHFIFIFSFYLSLPFLHVICFLHFIFFFSFYLSLLFLHVICLKLGLLSLRLCQLRAALKFDWHNWLFVETCQLANLFSLKKDNRAYWKCCVSCYEDTLTENMGCSDCSW
jgi:hypothetical protein